MTARRPTPPRFTPPAAGSRTPSRRGRFSRARAGFWSPRRARQTPTATFSGTGPRSSSRRRMAGASSTPAPPGSCTMPPARSGRRRRTRPCRIGPTGSPHGTGCCRRPPSISTGWAGRSSTEGWSDAGHGDGAQLVDRAWRRREPRPSRPRRDPDHRGRVLRDLHRPSGVPPAAARDRGGPGGGASLRRADRALCPAGLAALATRDRGPRSSGRASASGPPAKARRRSPRWSIRCRWA